GIDSIVDAAVPTSGPTHADIFKSCLQEPRDDYDNSGINDLSFCFRSGGPCATHDASFTNLWVSNSAQTVGIYYNYPNTRVHIITGGLDLPATTNRVNDYYQVLLQAQQPLLTLQVVPNMSHTIQQEPDGLAALISALTASGVATPMPTPTPSPSSTPTATATPTPTPSATATPTETPTSTPSATATPTETPTPSPTATATPTATPTVTPIPTPTPTPTPSVQVTVQTNPA